MKWDDELYEDRDDFDFANKQGIYAEDENDEDQEDELLLSGLDPDELELMDEDERREAIEEAGLDPDDFEDLF